MVKKTKYNKNTDDDNKKLSLTKLDVDSKILKELEEMKKQGISNKKFAEMLIDTYFDDLKNELIRKGFLKEKK